MPLRNYYCELVAVAHASNSGTRWGGDKQISELSLAYRVNSGTARATETLSFIYS